MLDTQAEQHQQISAQDKQIRDIQALVVDSRKLLASYQARHEEVERAAAAGLSKLRAEVSAARVRKGSNECFVSTVRRCQ